MHKRRPMKLKLASTTIRTMTAERLTAAAGGMKPKSQQSPGSFIICPDIDCHPCYPSQG